MQIHDLSELQAAYERSIGFVMAAYRVMAPYFVRMTKEQRKRYVRALVGFHS